jgi:peptidoglycan hydrolase CwlO-like protein
MTVKLEVPQIDKELLSKKETMISDLELEKAKLEAKIQEISSQYNLVLSNADELKEKVEIF